MRTKNAVVSGQLFKEKASQIALTLNVPSFSGSNGWMEGVKERNSIKFVKTVGERADADTPSAENWTKTVLPQLLETYDENDIYNADEMALYYRALPKHTLTTEKEAPAGVKMAKERLTVLVVVNKNGSDKKLHVIGKFEKPRCFRRVQELPLKYYHNTSAWMTTALFTKIILTWNSQLLLEDRRIVLVLDTASTHKIPAPSNIQLIFLPPNTTSVAQPCDAGIIWSIKAQYRKILNRKQLLFLQANAEKSTQEFVKSITILDAMFMLKRSLFLLSPVSIENCFKKAWQEVPEIEESVSSEDEDFENFVSIDDNVATSGPLSLQEICDNHRENNEVEINETEIGTEAEK